MGNRYGGLLERWKVDLIVARAWKRGLQYDEIQDAQQEIVPTLLGFRFEPERCNGATLRTVLTGIIDRRLVDIIRARGRRHEPLPEQAGRVCDAGCAEDHRRMDLAADVETALAGLPPQARDVCVALSQGQSRSGVARRMGLSRHEVDHVIEQVRMHFVGMGFDACLLA